MKIRKTNIYGRSMIEMLGVLAIVGVLSIGGYEMVYKAMQQHRDNQLIAQTMSLVTQARKIVCQRKMANLLFPKPQMLG